MSVYHNGQKVLNNITSVNEEAMKEIAKEVYSTEEQVIGTWIDGKPIYRKVLICTTDTALGYSGSDYDDWKPVPGWTVTIPNINEYVNVNSPITAGKRVDYTIRSNKTLQFYSLSGTHTVQKGSPLIIEYTKTTD